VVLVEIMSEKEELMVEIMDKIVEKIVGDRE
jgi:hypothetical protein